MRTSFLMGMMPRIGVSLFIFCATITHVSSLPVHQVENKSAPVKFLEGAARLFDQFLVEMKDLANNCSVISHSPATNNQDHKLDKNSQKHGPVLLDSSSMMYMATSIEQAVLHFPKLLKALLDPDPSDEEQNVRSYAVTIDDDDDDGSRCMSDRCKRCSRALLSRVNEFGWIVNQTRTFETLNVTELSKIVPYDDCDMFDVPTLSASETRALSSDPFNDFEIAVPKVGTRMKLFCVRRGDPIAKRSRFVSLCDYCWVWRKMPDGYFPQYLNEIICASDTRRYPAFGGSRHDKTCFTDHGRCQPMEMSIQVKPTADSRPEQVESVDVVINCNCFFLQASAFLSYIRN